MRPPGLEQVTERGEARMNRMGEPETRYVAGRVGREIRLGGPTLTHERVALRVEDLDHAPQPLHEPGAGADLQHRGDEVQVVDEMSRPVATNARQRERHEVVPELGVEEHAEVLAAQ